MLFGSGVIRKPCWPGNLLKPRKTLLSLSGFRIQHRPRINLICARAWRDTKKTIGRTQFLNYRFLHDRAMHIESLFHPIRSSSGVAHGADGLIDCAAPPCINRAEAAAAPAPATPRRIQPV